VIGFNLSGWVVQSWDPRPLAHEVENLRATKDGMVLLARSMQRASGPTFIQATLTRAKPPLSRGVVAKVLASVLPRARWVRRRGSELWVAILPEVKP
jgi:hypothetical protein